MELYEYFLLGFLYFVVGGGLALICFTIQYDDFGFSPMSEEDKNKFAVIVAFWPIWIPVKLVRRSYLAIRTT